MKKTVLLIFTLILFGTTAWAGNTVANGGDVVAADFAQRARKLINGYKEKRFQEEYRPIIANLKRVLLTTKVRSEENLKLDSQEVNAINIPAENLIIVNRSTWDDLKSKEKYFLILHEYLWIAGYDDSSYQISSAIKEQAEYVYPIVFPSPDAN